MAKYRGTCIGGVADGHWLERDDVEIKIDARKKKPGGEEGEVVLETSVYKFVLLLGTSNAEIGVWALHDWPLERIVERLVRCYNPRTGLIGTPAANPLKLKQ